MSTVPLATSGRRVADVTGLYFTLRFGMASFAFTASTTCLHSSIENPIGCNLSSKYDNGIELSRWPMVKVPVSEFAVSDGFHRLPQLSNLCPSLLIFSHCVFPTVPNRCIGIQLHLV